jgi:putative FmdB family regulatory protein
MMTKIGLDGKSLIMPAYDYRCNQCGRSVTLFYKTYKEYDAASHTCPHCNSTSLTRLISRVAVARPSRDYGNMSANEMLNVLEGGDSREVGSMFEQVGAGDPSLGADYHDATQRLLRGESPESIENDLRSESSLGDDV